MRDQDDVTDLINRINRVMFTPGKRVSPELRALVPEILEALDKLRAADVERQMLERGPVNQTNRPTAPATRKQEAAPDMRTMHEEIKALTRLVKQKIQSED